MKLITLICLFILTGCSNHPSLNGDWYRYDSSTHQYDWLIFKSSMVLNMVPAFDKRNYPYILSKKGSYNINKENLLVVWENDKTENGKINNDSTLILAKKIYHKKQN